MKSHHHKLSYTERLKFRPSGKHCPSAAFLEKPGPDSVLAHPVLEVLAVRKGTWLRRAKPSSMRPTGGQHRTQEHVVCSASDLRGLDVSTEIRSICLLQLLFLNSGVQTNILTQKPYQVQ